MEVMILQRRRVHSVVRQMPHGAVLAAQFHQYAQLSLAEHLLRLERAWLPECSMFASAWRLSVVRSPSKVRPKAGASDR
jgi:hypothetical protein